MRDDQRVQHDAANQQYQPPRLTRFGTFRELTREGLVGNADGGLILAADGNPTPAAEPRATTGSR